MDDDELDRLRRVVYGPDPDPQSLQRYEQLLLLRDQTEVASDGLDDEPAEDRSDERPARRRRRGPAVALPAALLAAAVLIVALQAAAARDRLPASLSAPALSGTTLVAYGNQRAVPASKHEVRYSPFGYTVFQPSGGSLHVALRCAGTGTVVITAGQRFPFRCTGPERVLHLDDERGHLEPFVVTGATTGDVVWAVRITERPLPGPRVTDLSRRFGTSG